MKDSRETLYTIKEFSFSYPANAQTIRWKGEHRIEDGERILLTGSSGSGKSTLMYGLMGLIPEIIYGKVEGDIYYRDKSIIRYPREIRGRAGLIMQNPAAQMLCSSVEEELAFGLENQRNQVGDIKTEISEWAERFEIHHLLARKTASLSGGEKQKITLLSILMTQPEILMLDEPTAFLDPQSAREIMSIIKEYQENKTLIFVEHNLTYLKEIILRNLHLQQDGEVQDLPASEVVWQTHLPPLEYREPGDKILELAKISYSYGKNEILHELDLSIHEGEILTIHGRNGSGKSTLLLIIAGLLSHYEGRITGKSNSGKTTGNELRMKTGLLFQNPENHFLYNRVEQEIQGNTSNYLAEEFRDKSQQNPFSLSEGEKRRLSTLISCDEKKKILLMDEPTFGQDIKNKLLLVELLGNLRDKGMGIVIVSHDRDFTDCISSRTFEMIDGRLEEIIQ
jgi:energy-coupling factor transport system ATP-binding protein